MEIRLDDDVECEGGMVTDRSNINALGLGEGLKAER